MPQVYMQPSGYLSCSGISATTPFLKRFLERFNIKAYFCTRERYKNVANQFTHVRPCRCLQSPLLVAQSRPSWQNGSKFHLDLR